MDEPIVVDAHQRYLAQQRHLSRGEGTERMGMIAVGLAIETHARIAERFGDDAFDERIGSHIAASLRNALDTVGIRDFVLDEYARQVASANATAGGVPEIIDSLGSDELCASQPYSDDASAPGADEADPAHTAPSSPGLAADRAQLLDAADASWLAVGNDPAWLLLLAEPGLTIEGYEETSPGVYRSRE